MAVLVPKEVVGAAEPKTVLPPPNGVEDACPKAVLEGGAAANELVPKPAPKVLVDEGAPNEVVDEGTEPNPVLLLPKAGVVDGAPNEGAVLPNALLPVPNPVAPKAPIIKCQLPVPVG